MQEANAIIDSKFKKIIKDLDYVGAKKVSRDTVEKNLSELKTELENHFAGQADNLKNKLVINRLQALLDEFKEMAGIQEVSDGI
jgi:hypothetical protein